MSIKVSRIPTVLADVPQRKTVSSKEGRTEGKTQPPSGMLSLVPSGELAMRLKPMEDRLLSLEDTLSRVLGDVREARNREVIMTTLLRTIIGHMAAVEKGEATGCPLHRLGVDYG